jgi:hypothetical protein
VAGEVEEGDVLEVDAGADDGAVKVLAKLAVVVAEMRATITDIGKEREREERERKRNKEEREREDRERKRYKEEREREDREWECEKGERKRR